MFPQPSVGSPTVLDPAIFAPNGLENGGVDGGERGFTEPYVGPPVNSLTVPDVVCRTTLEDIPGLQNGTPPSRVGLKTRASPRGLLRV